jgi:hypothetical protein
LLESPSDWKPWEEAPFDPYPPKNKTRRVQYDKDSKKELV